MAFGVDEGILQWLRDRHKIPPALTALHEEDLTPAFVWALCHDAPQSSVDVTWRDVADHIAAENMVPDRDVDMQEVAWLLAAGDCVTQLWLLEVVYAHVRAYETYESAANPVEFFQMTLAQSCGLAHHTLAGWYNFAQLEALFLYRLLEENPAMTAQCLTFFGYGLLSADEGVVVAAAHALRAVVRENPKLFWQDALGTRGGAFDVALRVRGGAGTSRRSKQAVNAVLAEFAKADLAAVLEEEVPCRVSSTESYFNLLEDLYTAYIADSAPTPFGKMLHPDIITPASGAGVSGGGSALLQNPFQPHVPDRAPAVHDLHDPAMFFETDAFVGALLAREGALPSLIHRVLADTAAAALSAGAVAKIYVFILRVALRNLEVFTNSSPGDAPAVPVSPIWDEIRHATPMRNISGAALDHFPLTPAEAGKAAHETDAENTLPEEADSEAGRRGGTGGSSRHTPSTPALDGDRSLAGGSPPRQQHSGAAPHGSQEVTLLGLLVQHLAWLWRNRRVALDQSNIVAHLAAVMVRCFSKAVPGSAARGSGGARVRGGLAFHAAQQILDLYVAAADGAWAHRHLYTQYLLAAARDLPNAGGVGRGVVQGPHGHPLKHANPYCGAAVESSGSLYHVSCLYAVDAFAKVVADGFIAGRETDSTDVSSLLELGGVVAAARDVGGGDPVADGNGSTGGDVWYASDIRVAAALWWVALTQGVVLHTHALHALIVQLDRTVRGVVAAPSQRALFAESVGDLVRGAMHWAYCAPLAAVRRTSPQLDPLQPVRHVGSWQGHRLGPLPGVRQERAASSPSAHGARAPPSGHFRSGSAGALRLGGADPAMALRAAFDVLNERDQILRNTLQGVLRCGAYEACGAPHPFVQKVVLRALESSWRGLRNDTTNALHTLPPAHAERAGGLLDSLVSECGGGVPAAFTAPPQRPPHGSASGAGTGPAPTTTATESSDKPLPRPSPKPAANGKAKKVPKPRDAGATPASSPAPTAHRPQKASGQQEQKNSRDGRKGGAKDKALASKARRAPQHLNSSLVEHGMTPVQPDLPGATGFEARPSEGKAGNGKGGGPTPKPTPQSDAAHGAVPEKKKAKKVKPSASPAPQARKAPVVQPQAAAGAARPAPGAPHAAAPDAASPLEKCAPAAAAAAGDAVTPPPQDPPRRPHGAAQRGPKEMKAEGVADAQVERTEVNKRGGGTGRPKKKVKNDTAYIPGMVALEEAADDTAPADPPAAASPSPHVGDPHPVQQCEVREPEPEPELEPEPVPEEEPEPVPEPVPEEEPEPVPEPEEGVSGAEAEKAVSAGPQEEVLVISVEPSPEAPPADGVDGVDPGGDYLRPRDYAQRCSIQEFDELAMEDGMNMERKSTLYRLCVAKGLIDPSMKLTDRSLEEKEKKKQRMRGYFTHMEAIAAAKEEEERRHKKQEQQKLNRILDRQKEIEVEYETRRVQKAAEEKAKAEQAERERVETERKVAAAKARHARRQEENKAKLEDYKRQKAEEKERERSVKTPGKSSGGGWFRPSHTRSSGKTSSVAASSPMKSGNSSSGAPLSRTGSKLSARTASTDATTPHAASVVG
eukprot:TRINITY_DN2942_c0_g1_i2.p1 TRINITY_DN2942_c0_g1~~TRINITY_DN2942_c0_g1_i2.p1  ORF type:complete len:1619 (+),score=463.97 TRINITY_DN2942_c0_g1_i2:151-4857(+)